MWPIVPYFKQSWLHLFVKSERSGLRTALLRDTVTAAGDNTHGRVVQHHRNGYLVGDASKTTCDVASHVSRARLSMRWIWIHRVKRLHSGPETLSIVQNLIGKLVEVCLSSPTTRRCSLEVYIVILHLDLFLSIPRAKAIRQIVSLRIYTLQRVGYVIVLPGYLWDRSPRKIISVEMLYKPRRQRISKYNYVWCVVQFVMY